MLRKHGGPPLFVTSRRRLGFKVRAVVYEEHVVCFCTRLVIGCQTLTMGARDLHRELAGDQGPQ